MMAMIEAIIHYKKYCSQKVGQNEFSPFILVTDCFHIDMLVLPI